MTRTQLERSDESVQFAHAFSDWLQTTHPNQDGVAIPRSTVQHMYSVARELATGGGIQYGPDDAARYLWGGQFVSARTNFADLMRRAEAFEGMGLPDPRMHNGVGVRDCIEKMRLFQEHLQRIGFNGRFDTYQPRDEHPDSDSRQARPAARGGGRDGRPKEDDSHGPDAENGRTGKAATGGGPSDHESDSDQSEESHKQKKAKPGKEGTRAKGQNKGGKRDQRKRKGKGKRKRDTSDGSSQSGGSGDDAGAGARGRWMPHANPAPGTHQDIDVDFLVGFRHWVRNTYLTDKGTKLSKAVAKKRVETATDFVYGRGIRMRTWPEDIGFARRRYIGTNTDFEDLLRSAEAFEENGYPDTSGGHRMTRCIKLMKLYQQYSLEREARRRHRHGRN
jgi:uncharacterized membrane protein YgcG